MLAKIAGVFKEKLPDGIAKEIKPSTLVMPYGLNIHREQFDFADLESKKYQSRSTQTDEALMLDYVRGLAGLGVS